jgi:hypothetical protein
VSSLSLSLSDCATKTWVRSFRFVNVQALICSTHAVMYQSSGRQVIVRSTGKFNSDRENVRSSYPQSLNHYFRVSIRGNPTLPFLSFCLENRPRSTPVALIHPQTQNTENPSHSSRPSQLLTRRHRLQASMSLNSVSSP